jgi:hypothetical protein
MKIYSVNAKINKLYKNLNLLLIKCRTNNKQFKEKLKSNLKIRNIN